MKINYNCLRELLIVLEENLQFSDGLLGLQYPKLTFSEIIPLMPDYSAVDIAYSTIMAKEAELIYVNIVDAADCFRGCIYASLTYKGHKFLENIKSNNVWNQTKKIAGKIGNISLDIISSIASKLVQDLITQQFQL